MEGGEWGMGFALVTAASGAAGWTGWNLRRWLLPGWSGAAARLAEIVGALAVATTTLQLLGLVGALRPGWAIALLLAVGVGAHGLGRSRTIPTARRMTHPPEDPLGLALAAAGLVVVVAQWAGRALASLDHGVNSVDSIWYHLPFAARFAQEGSVVHLHHLDFEYLTGFYPLNSELLQALGMAAFDGDIAATVVALGWMALALLGGWCVGRPRGAGAYGALGVGVALGVPTMIETQAGQAASDIAGLALFVSAAALLTLGRGDRSAIAMAALAAGFALGAKLTFLAPVGALTLGVVVLARPPSRLRTAAVWGGGVAAVGGFWYVRNLWLTGNPLPWLDPQLGPLSLPAPRPPLQGDTGFTVAHYATDTHLWSSVFRPGLEFTLGPLWPAVLGLAAGGAVFAIVAGRDPWVRMLGAVAAAAGLAYLVTPGSAAGPEGTAQGFSLNVRYLTPALALGAALLPLAVADRGRSPRPVGIACLVVLLVTQTADDLWPPPHAAASVGLAGGALAAAAVVWRVRGRRLAPAAVAAAAGVALVGVYVVGERAQRHYLAGRYAPGGVPALFGFPDRHLHLLRRTRGARVAMAGTAAGFFHHPVYGPDLSNRVDYIGRRGPHGSFSPVRGCRAWRRALDRGRYDLVIVTPRFDVWRPARRRAAPEAAWTRSSPAARRVLAGGEGLEVFRLSGPSGTAGCP